MRIPSVLGRDILNKHALVYDKRHEKAYITDETLPKANRDCKASEDLGLTTHCYDDVKAERSYP